MLETKEQFQMEYELQDEKKLRNTQNISVADFE